MKRLAALVLPILAALPTQAQDFYDPDVLRTVDLQFHDANWWTLLEQNYDSQTEILADMTVEGVTYPDVGVRIRGNSSYFFLPPDAEKVSLNVTVDFVHPDQEVMGVSTLNLNNAFSDPTFCREVVFFNILNRWVPAGRANHVVVTLNGDNWGVYANIQQYGKKVLEEFFEDEDGLRIKCANNPSGPGLQYFGPSPGSYSDYEVKDDGGLADPFGALLAVCEAVDDTPPANWPEVDEVFAIDPSIWSVVLENLFSDDDSYVHKGCDFTLYRDPLDGRTHLHQTDGNESWTHATWNADYNFGAANKPFLSNILSAPELRGRYFAHLRKVLADELDPVALAAEFAARRAVIDSAVQADPKKLYTYQNFLDNFDSTVNVSGPFSPPVIGLNEYVAQRRALLLADPEVTSVGPTISGLGHSSEEPGVAIFVSADVAGPDPIDSVDLWYRESRAMPYSSVAMLDDGLSGDGAAGDGVYGAALPSIGVPGEKVWYYVGATAQNAFAAQSFEPSRTEMDPVLIAFQGGTVESDVVINEFLARNNSVNQDPSGSFEDWVEVRNRSGVSVDVSGMYLSDSLLTPTEWQFPVGTILAPGETVLVWADEDTAEGPLHADFKLASDGEEIGLWDIDGLTLLDSVVFGPQAIDVSTGRVDDGLSKFVTFTTPTPDQSNADGCGLRTYDQLDPFAHTLDAVPFGVGALGTTVTITGAGFLPASLATFAIGFESGHTPLGLPGVVALLGGAVTPLTLPADGFGLLPIQVFLPVNPILVGLDIYFQFGGVTAGGGVSGSNAVHLNICP